MKIVLLMLALAVSCLAGPLGGPQPGFILDGRTGSLRPLLGMPGAMQLGAPVSLAFGVTSAGFDPNGNFAVVVSNEKPSHLYLVQGLTNSPVTTDFGAIADNSTVLAIDGGGQNAVVSAPGQLQFLTGLQGTPVLANALPTQALLGPITTGILDAAGQCALVGTSAGGTGAFESFCPDGTSQRFLLQQGMQIAGIALANQGQDAILGDSGGQQVLRVAGYAQTAAVTAVATANDGINTPAGVQVSGQLAIVADAGATAIFAIDLSGQTAIQTIALNTAPAKLAAVQDRSLLLLNDPTATPFTIFDLHAMQSFFIPAN
jgi:hypothetical protein